MPKAIRYTLLSLRDLAVSVGPFLILAVALLLLAYWWLDPQPPKRVVLATGPAQSAYDEFGKRYAKELARYGIRVELRQSEGSTNNLRLLRDGTADFGFVQGGTNNLRPGDTEKIASLGSLFLEPVWLFYRKDAVKKKVSRNAGVTSLTQLDGLRVNLGNRGSGVPNLMRKLLDINHIDPKSMTVTNLDQTPATVGLINGDIDAIVFASAPESLMVQMLLMTPGIGLMDFVQSEAYSRRFPFLSSVSLPRGIVDLAQDVPGQDVHLVAPTTSLLTRQGTHPALIQLFSGVAHRLHGPAGWFNKAGDFPNARHDELPLAVEAERYLKSGEPWLQHYLPFWLANLIERMWLSLGIIIAILLPLSRVLPPLYQFRVRSRVFRWYARLREIEDQVSDPPDDPGKLTRDLDELERRVEKVSVPLSYVDELYALRNHITMVREKLLTRAAT